MPLQVRVSVTLIGAVRIVEPLARLRRRRSRSLWSRCGRRRLWALGRPGVTLRHRANGVDIHLDEEGGLGGQRLEDEFAEGDRGLCSSRPQAQRTGKDAEVRPTKFDAEVSPKLLFLNVAEHAVSTVAEDQNDDWKVLRCD